jgi:cell division protein FtsB
MGVGVVATDEGDLVTFVYHASPIPPAAEIKARIAAAVLAHKAAKQAAKAELDALKAEVKNLKEKEKVK